MTLPRSGPAGATPRDSRNDASAVRSRPGRLSIAVEAYRLRGGAQSTRRRGLHSPRHGDGLRGHRRVSTRTLDRVPKRQARPSSGSASPGSHAGSAVRSSGPLGKAVGLRGLRRAVAGGRSPARMVLSIRASSDTIGIESARLSGRGAPATAHSVPNNSLSPIISGTPR